MGRTMNKSGWTNGWTNWSIYSPNHPDGSLRPPLDAVSEHVTKSLLSENLSAETVIFFSDKIHLVREAAKKLFF